MTGAGNDFIIIDARGGKFPKLDRVAFAKRVCDRHFGMGADGLFLIEKASTKGVNFKWDFYNADGSFAEMCGNGARCVARFAFDKKIAPAKMRFETGAGIVTANVSKKVVEVVMTKPKKIFGTVNVPMADGTKLEVAYWDTGVPHVVKQTDDWSDEYLQDVGVFLRNHDFFKKTNGANATFFQIVGTSHVQAATFERGVEDITLACGTGAVAAAVQAFTLGEKSPIRVEMPGGTLMVKISEDLSTVSLSGDAKYICQGKLSAEVFS